MCGWEARFGASRIIDVPSPDLVKSYNAILWVCLLCNCNFHKLNENPNEKELDF